MTIRVDGVDVMQAVEIASVVGSIFAMLVIGLIVYLLVRPSRRAREDRPPEPAGLDAAELIAVMERMERRLEVLERAVADDLREEDRLLNAGDGSPENRRKK